MTTFQNQTRKQLQTPTQITHPPHTYPIRWLDQRGTSASDCRSSIMWFTTVSQSMTSMVVQGRDVKYMRDGWTDGWLSLLKQSQSVVHLHSTAVG